MMMKPRVPAQEAMMENSFMAIMAFTMILW